MYAMSLVYEQGSSSNFSQNRIANGLKATQSFSEPTSIDGIG